jgi:hypothetical protein
LEKQACSILDITVSDIQSGEGLFARKAEADQLLDGCFMMLAV